MTEEEKRRLESEIIMERYGITGYGTSKCPDKEDPDSDNNLEGN